MTPEEQKDKERVEQHYLQCARDMRAITDTAKCQSEDKAFSTSTEFVRLEVQIATLLFALVGVFLDTLSHQANLNFLGAKIALAVAVISLIISLIMGLLHLKREERFLDSITHQRVMRTNKWKEAVEGTISFETAKAFHEGTTMGRGPVISSPQWPWILQTIFLGIGITFLFSLLLAFIFI